MAHYVAIPAADFEAALESWGFAEGAPAGRERTWERYHKRMGVRLICYSSLPVGGDTARSVGADAIRVVAVWTGPDGREKALLKLPRVHRVAGWVGNLHERLREAWRQVAATPACPACGSPTVERKRRSDGGAFFGCVSYPACTGVARGGAS